MKKAVEGRFGFSWLVSVFGLSKMSSNGSNSFANDASLSSWKDNPASHQIASQTATPESLMEKQSSSFPWILHHILEKEPSNELPLRIMFTFNAGTKKQFRKMNIMLTWIFYRTTTPYPQAGA